MNFQEMQDMVLTMVGLPDDGQADPRQRVMVRNAINVAQRMLVVKIPALGGRVAKIFDIRSGLVQADEGRVRSVSLLESRGGNGGARRVTLRMLPMPQLVGLRGTPIGWRWERSFCLDVVTVLAGGTGATGGLPVVFDAPSGVPGIQATGSVSAVNNGAVTGVTISNAGWGYSGPVFGSVGTPASGVNLSASLKSVQAMRVFPEPDDGFQVEIVYDWVPDDLDEAEDLPAFDAMTICALAAANHYPMAGNDQGQAAVLMEQAKALVSALRSQMSGSQTIDLDPQRAIGGWCEGGRG